MDNTTRCGFKVRMIAIFAAPLVEYECGWEESNMGEWQHDTTPTFDPT